jgi:hypothetical protein
MADSRVLQLGLHGFNSGRLQELREQIDAGRPVPLGLFKAGNGGFGPHHQVVAVGYDLGRYTGDLGEFKEDLKIFIYDSNHPGEIVTLVPSVADHYYHYEKYPMESWMTYFVDNPAASNDLVTQLILEIRTGGDDLRGGNDNVNATVTFKNQPPLVVHNLNNGARWIGNYTQTVPITLNHPVPLDEITSVVLTTTFGGGIGGDNWNVDSLRISAAGKVLYQADGNPLVRFTGDNKPPIATIQVVA